MTIIKLVQALNKAIWTEKNTVKQLKQWFKLVDNVESDIYYKKLVDYLSKYDKKPNKMLKLYNKK